MEEFATPEEMMPQSEYREISIWLDKYEDLFSDFDSSAFHERTLSDNFLTEVRKLVHQVDSDKIELKFNLMADATNTEIEGVIISNIHDYFILQAKAAQAEKQRILSTGGILTAAGFTLISILIVIGHNWGGNMILNGLEMMLDPFGWFLCWTGLDMIFVQSKKEKPTIDFNMKMANAKLTFLTFGMPVILEEIEQTVEELRKAS